MRFLDRADAGRRLGALLRGRKGDHPLVLGIAHGGTTVGRAVAEVLEADFDEVWIGRVRLPGSDEPIGAVDEAGHVFLAIPVTYGSPSPSAVDHAIRSALGRLKSTRTALHAIEARGRRAIVVDEGAGTGAAMVAAIRFVRSLGAIDVVAALPVVSAAALERVREEADGVVALSILDPFPGVDAAYERFSAQAV